jgi:ribonuclease P protein component
LTRGGVGDGPAASEPPSAAPGESFKALLATPSLAKTPHFSLHATPQRPVLQQLTTDAAPDRTESVDNKAAVLMLVVPKRHARRAVTRNLIKRQMREAVKRRRATQGAAAVLIRQRSAFNPKQFPSAASAALREAVRRELDELFDRAGARR